MFPSPRLLYDLGNTQTHAVDQRGVVDGMQIENYMLHYGLCFSSPCCADPLALSQGIKRDGGDSNGGINSRLLAEGSEGERPLADEEGQRPEKVPAHCIPLARRH